MIIEVEYSAASQVNRSKQRPLSNACVVAVTAAEKSALVRCEFKSKVASMITNKTKITDAREIVSALLHKCDF